jgi:hypothetical protein
MQIKPWISSFLLCGAVGCNAPATSGAVTIAEDERAFIAPAATGAAALPEPTCSAAPALGARLAWRHPFKSPFIVAFAAPQHRGVDLIVGAGAAVQPIRGEIHYGLTDKALEDETVELFACRAGSWEPLGSTITDGEGRFELDLRDGARLPIGQRSLYVSVGGDRSGVGFVGLVAPAGGWLAASDVDGTLTESENAFATSLLTQAAVAVQAEAPAAIATLVHNGYQPIYVTARGRVFTEATRSWLAAQGFPRGPLRLADSIITLPGAPTVDYKASVLSTIEAAGLVVEVGIGNRASDAEAYARAGIGGQEIFLKLPEFASECAPVIAAGQATGFDSYGELTATLAGLPPAP